MKLSKKKTQKTNFVFLLVTYGGATSYILQLISYYMEIIWDTGLTYLTNNKVTVHFRSFTGRIVAFHIPSSKKYIQIKVCISLDFAVPAFSRSKLIGEDIIVFVPRSNDNFYNLLDYMQHEENVPKTYMLGTNVKLLL